MRKTVGVIVLLLAMVLSDVGLSQASFRGDNGRIAYVDFGYSTGDQEIYTLLPDGSGVRRLTRNSTGDVDPAWSPDGSRIVYRCRAPFGERANQKSGEICVMNGDGSHVQRLTDNKVADTSPTWSPDGRWIVFARIFQLGPGEFQWDLFKMRSDGSGRRRLTNDLFYDDLPEWSPDGKRIAFVSDRPGNQDIFSMRPNGRRKRNLTRSEEAETYPSWSPNGRRIVFSRFARTELSDEGWQIYKMRRNGTEPMRLTEDGAGSDLAAVWSPNGRWIAFTRDDDLFKMRPDGSLQRRLTGGSSKSDNYEVAPDWQPR